MEPKEKPTEDEVNRRFARIQAQEREAIQKAADDERRAERFKVELKREADERATRYASASDWVLKSGRRMEHPPGDLSIDFEDGGLRYGYDCPIWLSELTAEERQEIADAVCAIWRAWADE